MEPMETIGKIYVGEYSPEQGCYNVCTIEEMLEINLHIMKNQEFSGYIPLCFGESFEEVNKKLNEIEKQYGRPKTTCDEEG